MMRLPIVLVITIMVYGQIFGQLPKKAKTISMNGIDMYFEVYGEGEPLLLLHGWTQSSSFWKEYISTYAQKFEIYVLDLRGHGKTSPINGDFTIKKTADDILAFLDYLNLKKVKGIGLSYGGLALLQFTSLHSERVESMILIGVSQKYNGSENSQIGDTFTYENLPQSFKAELMKIHSRGELQVKALFDKNLDYQIDLTDQEVKAITSKTLLVQGDRDELLGIDPAIKLYRNLPNSELWIVPNAGHISITGSNKKTFLTKSLEFLVGME